MRLTGEQVKQIRAALLNAYSEPAELRQMVRIGLDEELGHIAGGADLRTIVFNLIMWAEGQDRIEELIRSASADRPRNEAVQNLMGILNEPEQRGDEGRVGMVFAPTIFGYLHRMRAAFDDFEKEPYILHLSDEVLIGRSSDQCNLVVPDAFILVGGVHAKIFQRSGEVFVEDLRTKNGTYVSSRRITEPTRLAPGQRIQLGGPHLRPGVCVLEFSLKPYSPTLTNPDLQQHG